MTVLARATSARGELVLRRRVDDDGVEVLELRANGVFVMDTRETSTERALASEALALVPSPCEVLVGGLGLGFTVETVLADPRVRRCRIVEIEPALVGWMGDGTIAHGARLLADPRVVVTVADVGEAVAAAEPGSLDLVLLDVDNGPGYLVHDTNAALYQQPFLAAVRRALAPDGTVAVWSAARAPTLALALEREFGGAVEHGYDVRLQDRDEHYWLYAAQVASRA